MRKHPEISSIAQIVTKPLWFVNSNFPKLQRSLLFGVSQGDANAFFTLIHVILFLMKKPEGGQE
jgi:hypothetical protein